MKAVVEIVKITPKQAEGLLTSQVKEQRPLRNSHVKSLAQDMTNGDFRLSADALVLIRGALANGQHRLWAVIESNTTQTFLMMTTDDEELYKVLDCGLRRTVGDAAHVSNGTSVAAMARMAIAFERGNITQFAFTKKPARVETIEYIQANHDLLQEAHTFIRGVTQKYQNLAPASAGGTLIVITRPKHGIAAMEFLSQVYSGSTPGSPGHELRERFIRMRMQKGRGHSSQYCLALMIKSFNAFVWGLKLTASSLKVGEVEDYPKICKPR